MDLEYNITTLNERVDALRFDFTISVIIIGIVLLLCLILSAILYGWLYTVEKKLKQMPNQDPGEFKIRRAQIREDFSRDSSQHQSLSSNQNPLARSNNYTAVVDDLKRNTTTFPNAQQTKYPNYIGDNSNFTY